MSAAVRAVARPVRRDRTRQLRAKERRRLWALSAAQLVCGILVLVPILWMFAAAFRTDLDIRSGSLVPQTFTLANFARLFGMPVVRSAFVNSMIVAVVAAAICTFAALLAAYALARFTAFPGRRITLVSITLTQAIPGLVVLVPLVVAMRQLHLTDSLVGLVIGYMGLTLPIGVLLFFNYLQGIPESLEEAAMVDGCGRIGALWRVTVPLIRPALATVYVFAFITAWGEYVLALSLIVSDNVKTMPLAMQTLFEQYTVNLGLVMAFGVLISAPVVILFLLVQKNLTANLTAGGVK
jgi:ABC-type glycerol-3-phosphate transport system permease component